VGKVSVSDFNDIQLPERKLETPDTTVRLFISLYKEAAPHLRDLDAIATALSLRYNYPIWKELTPDSHFWERLYCKKVLDAAWMVIKRNNTEKKSGEK
jgi:hypothetical protein